MKRQKLIRLQLLLDEKLFKKLSKHSFDTTISKCAIARLALKKYLKGK
jgi:hypothetical protein